MYLLYVFRSSPSPCPKGYGDGDERNTKIVRIRSTIITQTSLSESIVESFVLLLLFNIVRTVFTFPEGPSIFKVYLVASKYKKKKYKSVYIFRMIIVYYYNLIKKHSNR